MKKKKIGTVGERKTALYLRLRLYRIVAKNFKSLFGEIDIIAKQNKYLCFVEVKTRGENSLGTPSEAVNTAKQSRIIKTAYSYLHKHPSSLMPRFDIAEVSIINGKYKINYIKNAFEATKQNSNF